MPCIIPQHQQHEITVEQVNTDSNTDKWHILNPAYVVEYCQLTNISSSSSSFICSVITSNNKCRNTFCYDHFQVKSWRCRPQDHIFIKQLFLRKIWSHMRLVHPPGCTMVVLLRAFENRFLTLPTVNVKRPNLCYCV